LARFKKKLIIFKKFAFIMVDTVKMDKKIQQFQASHSKMVLNQSGFSIDPWGVKKG
jgi:hypothetical protein